jgi:PAS domain S-box-containing protein
MPAAFDSSTGGVPDGIAAGAGPSSGAGAGALLDLIRIATFVLDTEGRIVVWSPTAADLTGRPVEQVLGTNVADLFPADTRPRAGELFRRASRAGGWVGVLPMLRGDAAVFDVGFRAMTLQLPDGPDLVQVVATDAGDLRRFEFERTLFEALFDQVPVGIAIYDTDRRYIGVNDALAAYNGIPAREHLGHRVEDLVPDTARTVPPLQQRVLETGEPVVDVLVRAAARGGRAGERRYWSVSYARLQDRDGRVLGLTSIVVDVTERQNAVERARLARRRAAILNAANNRIGTSLDITKTAAELVDVTVPMFCDQATVYLLDSATTSRNAAPARPSADASAEPISLHVIATRGTIASGTSATADRVGDSLPPIQPSTALYECVTGGRARLLDMQDAMRAGHTVVGRADESRADNDRADRSIVAPLVARGSLIGAVCFARVADRDEFALIDLETADELAARTAVSMDNARLYVRERDTALMLQRSLLPQRFPEVEGTRVAFRYRPGSVGAQVGGDWFDVFALPCRRVAFVVGDVMGSGLQAAGIMGQFRTAARTLAQLDLNPALVLRELDELAQSMSESHIATCVYAVYDPVVGVCCIASAGHPPPLLVTPGVGVEPVQLAPGAPLGVGGQRFEEREFMVEPASALAFYTDGLVEDRDRDIETGIDELLGTISKAVSSVAPPSRSEPGSESAPGGGWPEAACDAAFESLLGPHRVDDATLLIAELDRFPEDRVASWVLTSQPTVAARARELVRRRLEVWRPDVADVVELLVSELVTNALRYGRGPIGLRLLHGAATVVCEVSDELDAAPRLRTVHQGDEGGRGLYLVDQLSANWGTRTTTHGKIVWFEV